MIRAVANPTGHERATRSPKAIAQAMLRKVGLYHRLKASPIYDLYWRLSDRRILQQRATELTFYRTVLDGFQPGSLIFDIGANQGYKSAIFLKLGARVVAVEPDPHSQQVLKETFLQYRVFKPPLVIVGMAASDRDGIGQIWLDAPGSAKNTLSTKWVDILRNDPERFGTPLAFASTQRTATISLDSLIATHGVPFYIKIDVEGHEPMTLSGLRRPVRYLSFEVNLPEFRTEGAQCVERLAYLAPSGTFNYVVDCASGLALKQWANKRDFLTILDQCDSRSIEVFWKSEG